MRIVFMGSAELAVPSLRAILDAGTDEVVGVVSQPDRPAGRKRAPTPCSLKRFAEEQGLNVMTPEKIGAAESVAELEALRPDLFVVVAYGQYIPSRVINLAPHEAINVHPSLLPRYRGSAPIQWAIANGDKETGVSIIYLAPKMDAGDILRQEFYSISETITSGELHDELAVVGAELLLGAIEDIRGGKVSRVCQDESDVVEIRKLRKEDGQIDWGRPAKEIRDRIRAFDPWPGSVCVLPGIDGDDEVLKVWRVELEEGIGRPGEVLDDGLLIAAGSGAVRLLEVQPQGKRRMPAAAFLNGRSVVRGTLLV